MRVGYGSGCRGLAGLTVGCLLLVSAAASGASGDDRGTIGIRIRQLFDERQENHRGPLVVLRVEEDSPAAKAGIMCSDFIVAINGTPVAGREFAQIVKTDLQGPVGGTIRLTVLRYDGTQRDISVVRAPFPPHKSPPTDPFTYVVPGTWSTDPRYKFPLPWSPELAYQGFEDLFYVPNFNETDSPEYHSYIFFLWLEGTPAFDSAK